MAVNDELGITHPGLGDNPNLAAIVDLLIQQLKPMLVPRFASAAARAIAYPDITQAPKFNIVADQPEAWSTEFGAFYPLGGNQNWSDSKASNDVVAAGSPGQFGLSFSGPPGFYFINATMSISNNTTTDPVQIVNKEVRLDGNSSGIAPFTITSLPAITSVSHSWIGLSGDNTNSRTAQIVCTPQGYPAKIYAGTRIDVIYLGSFG